MKFVGTIYGAVFRLLRDLTCHRAETAENPTLDLGLKTRHYPESPSELLDILSQLIIEKLPHWGLERRDNVMRTIDATRQTPTFRFIDDIRIEIDPEGEGSKVKVTSASRIGFADFGQNRRNIKELLTSLDIEIESRRRLQNSPVQEALSWGTS